MGRMVEALRKVQAIEYQLAEVRRRLKLASAAVEAQQARIGELQQQEQALHEAVLARQRDSAAVELDLKQREQQVAKFRASLNTAKTNKEYAAILTQINSLKADNSRLEDEVLRVMQAVDVARGQLEQVKQQRQQNQGYLEEVKGTSGAEVARLETMLKELQQRRSQAEAGVPADALGVFNRVAAIRDGDAMAKIEIHGRKPPYEYVCGGCNMSIRAEHANALRARDEIRFCDVCGKILYLEEQAAAQQA
jgi:hypothetical protein